VWAVENSDPAVLHAYDASDVSRELYNSNQASAARDQFGVGNKFITPTIADGRVFVGTTNSIAVFGLFAPVPGFTLMPGNLSQISVGADGTVTHIDGDRVYAFGHRLLSIGPAEVAGARLSGIISGSEVTRPGRGQVNVIINGRWVQPRGLVHLLETAYRPVLPRGRHPVAALVIETGPDQIDIDANTVDKAADQLKELLKGAPDNPSYNNDLGYIWADHDMNLGESERLIRKAIEEDRKKRREAGEELTPAQDKDNPAYLDSLGRVLY